MSPLVITALIVADGASSIRVIRLWTSAWSTSAIADERDLDGRCRPAAPGGHPRSRGLRVDPEHEVDRVGVAELDAADGLRRQGGPDLGADLGRREPDADGPVRIDPDLDLRRGLDEVARDVRQARLAARAPPRRPRPSRRRRPASSALTTTLRLFVDAALLPDGHLVAVGGHGCEVGRELVDLRLEVHRGIEADDHRGAVGGRPNWAARIVWKPASPSPGRLVATSSTSGSARRISSACSARSSTCSELAPLGGAIVTWTIFSEPESMNAVGSSGTRPVDATNRTRGDGHRPDFGPAAPEHDRIAGS